MRQVSIYVILALVGYLSSYGLTIPHSLEYFRIIGAAAVMAGYAIPNYLQGIKNKLILALLILLSAVVVFGSFTAYRSLLETNPSGQLAVWVLSGLFFFGYLGFGLAMSFAGVILTEKSE